MYVMDSGLGGGSTANSRVKNVSTRGVATDTSTNILDGLYDELVALEGLKGQNPETGMNASGTFIGQYTNRLMGAPFQLLDSVDRRFSSINSNVGNEFLRNFIFNSPILYIKPGMPKYTGNIKADGIAQAMNNFYMDNTIGGMNTIESILMSVGTMIAGSGKDLQRRMFGFKETYHQYMAHVNYMLRNIANLMSLTTGVKFPNVVFTSEGAKPLASVKWENYRMMGNSKVLGQTDYLGQMLGAVIDGPVAAISAVGTAGGAALTSSINAIGKSVNAAATTSGIDTFGEAVGEFLTTLLSPSTASEVADTLDQAWADIAADFNDNKTLAGVIGNKITSVQFMVDPVGFEESLSNEIGQSIIGGAIDGLNSIGQEMQWISNSQVDAGILEGVFNFIGGSVETLQDVMSSAAGVLGGSFLSNLFDGAVQSVKGQKMLYPQIYKSSQSSMNYNYSITLTTPYGDPYNYFINIIVPLVHLIALAAPRMITSNAISSPYLVQAFIPGMSTCQLGMVTNMQVSKNPTGKHVSVHGYPLTVKVTFTISELYNNLSISPANDPSSFMFNETLNDYMANLAGLMPSIDTFEHQRVAQQQAFSQYMNLGDRADDLSQIAVERLEDFLNPFVGR